MKAPNSLISEFHNLILLLSGESLNPNQLWYRSSSCEELSFGSNFKTLFNITGLPWKDLKLIWMDYELFSSQNSNELLEKNSSFLQVFFIFVSNCFILEELEECKFLAISAIVCCGTGRSHYTFCLLRTVPRYRLHLLSTRCAFLLSALKRKIRKHHHFVEAECSNSYVLQSRKIY